MPSCSIGLCSSGSITVGERALEGVKRLWITHLRSSIPSGPVRQAQAGLSAEPVLEECDGRPEADAHSRQLPEHRASVGVAVDAEDPADRAM